MADNQLWLKQSYVEGQIAVMNAGYIGWEVEGIPLRNEGTVIRY